jgi:hypothetical protein
MPLTCGRKIDARAYSAWLADGPQALVFPLFSTVVQTHSIWVSTTSRAVFIGCFNCHPH